MQLIQSLDTKGKAILGAVALGFVAAVFLLFKLTTAPSWQTVQSGLDPAQTGKVTSALADKGIAFELQQNGSAVAVQEASVAQARIALAEAGVSGTAQQPGFELLDKQKLGASSFQQQVAYQRALEGQIAQTIGQVQGVGSAQVRLTLPKDELFTDEEKPSTAAVLLGSAGTLDGGGVRGIANLVASSVPGLKTDAVTITDAAGQMLWPQGEGGAAGNGAASKTAMQARYESQLQSQLDAMLARTVGPDKAQVQVRADLNVDDATKEQLEYATKGTPLTQTEESETLRGQGAAGQAAGTGSNIPAYAQGQAGGGGTSNYRKNATKTEFGVNKTVTRTRVAPGAVNRLSVSVMVDKAAKADVAAIQKAVEAAAGTQQGRDTVSVQEVTFAKPVEAPAPGPLGAIPGGIPGIAKIAGLGLGVLLFLFFMTRHLRKREDEELGEPAWLAQLAAAEREALPAAPAGQPAQPGMVIPTMQDFEDPRKMAIENLVEREPERVAAQLRTWITEE
ncbi:flagellar basal-body MS-ring/collar protein FliF [Conexibacter sp. SYSU D00693]|uniref:flagellar basal-body MS-ring/collar protein FliF n=1 Tax=Conexibacter sp. SYSU D00693 TaxID=2812560 RepID=UPI00196B8ECD|nr:flagellar basal-body MS-ring/collar protein FliF [Conexibacter sp. SYSU D00693]